MRIIITWLIVLTSSLCLIRCGSPSFDRQFHTVTEVIDGNTIKVDNRVTIHLIGVEDTRSSRNYLTKNLLNTKIRVRFDRNKRENTNSRTPQVYAYVMTSNRISLNAELLKQKLSNLNTQYLSDSLEAFKMYAQGLAYTPATRTPNRQPANTNRRENNRSRSTSIPESSSLNLADLVQEIEDAVFLVQTYDENGNGLGIGTGFFIDNKGTAISNHHVFENGSEWYVKTLDENYYRVERIIHQSSYHDYIVFKVENKGKSFPYLDLLNQLPSKGDDIFVIGNPKGLESTLTRGIVSAIRSINVENDFIQIDAAISPGSSGSPVLNMQGKVVGVATQKATECENCNYALFIGIVKEALNY